MVSLFLFAAVRGLFDSTSYIEYCTVLLAIRNNKPYAHIVKEVTFYFVMSFHVTDTTLGNVVPPHTMKALGERSCSSYSFSTSTLDEWEWSASLPGRALAPGKGHPVSTVQGARWAPRAGLETKVIGKILSSLTGIVSRPSDHSVRSQTLY
jgi:hypothetical protein